MLQVVVIVAMLSVLATAFLADGAVAARERLAQRIGSEMEIAMQRSVEVARVNLGQAVHTQIGIDGTTGVPAICLPLSAPSHGDCSTAPPPPAPLCADAAAPSCAILMVAYATYAGGTGVAATGGDTVHSQNVQDAIVVQERRVAFDVVVQLYVADAAGGASGTPIAARTRRVTFRTFAVPPFAIVTGEQDENADIGQVAVTPGDTAGASGGADTYDPANPSAYRDTTIHYKPLYANVAGANCNLGLPWGVQRGNGAYALGSTDATCPGRDPYPQPTPTPLAEDELDAASWSAGGGATGWNP